MTEPGGADLVLLQRIVARDDRAMAEFYDLHSRLAYSVILRIVRSPSDAEEVLQETFVRVWSRAETYDPRLGSPGAWLTRIARNRAIDRLRLLRARGLYPDVPAGARAGADVKAPEPETRDTPETVVEEAATAGIVRNVLATLPAAQRVLIEAAFFEGYTHNELSARFGVPLGTIKTRIRTGLTTMRLRLEHAV
jgi:RNA polymerase sigma-70 factor (ECF subfamily)